MARFCRYCGKGSDTILKTDGYMSVDDHERECAPDWYEPRAPGPATTQIAAVLAGSDPIVWRMGMFKRFVRARDSPVQLRDDEHHPEWHVDEARLLLRLFQEGTEAEWGGDLSGV